MCPYKQTKICGERCSIYARPVSGAVTLQKCTKNREGEAEHVHQTLQENPGSGRKAKESEEMRLY